MQLTAEIIKRISKVNPPAGNVTALMDAVNEYGPLIGVDQPHRLAQFLAQIMHESGGLKYNKEIWGPTAAQKKYEGRKDLGNTQKGDGSKYRGYGMIQVTGRANVTMFDAWCRRQKMNAPDFISKPEMIATSPWSAVSALWYWDMKNLNALADRGDIENITKKINGGLNGYDDRLDYYDRTCLVLLGYGVNQLVKFQTDEKLDTTTGSGPLTRAAFQKELLKLTDKVDQSKKVQTAPVVEKTKVEVKVSEPVVPVSVDHQVKKKTNIAQWFLGLGTFFSTTGTAIFGADWKVIVSFGGLGIVAMLLVVLFRHQLLGAFKEIRDGINQ